MTLAKPHFIKKFEFLPGLFLLCSKNIKNYVPVQLSYVHAVYILKKGKSNSQKLLIVTKLLLKILNLLLVGLSVN